MMFEAMSLLFSLTLIELNATLAAIFHQASSGCPKLIHHRHRHFAINKIPLFRNSPIHTALVKSNL